MIAVIADDFTGAAEIGGIGLRFGLRTEIETEVSPSSGADLMIVATDTRSLPAEEAVALVQRFAGQLKNPGVKWIYKKTDSVLRGNVLEEIIALLEATGKNRALLVPANPSNGRKILNGKYFVNGRLLHQTAFSHDPEYPRFTSDVLTLLGSVPQTNIRLLKKDQRLPENTVAVGEAVDETDIRDWAERVTPEIIPAGAADFFRALLEKRHLSENLSKSQFSLDRDNRSLYVCGSAFPSSREAISHASKQGAAVFEMPDDLFFSENGDDRYLKKWVNLVRNAFKKHSKVIVAINRPIMKNKFYPRKYRQYTAELVEKILREVTLDELFIEGGATAFSILNQAGIIKLIPEQKLAPGVIRMRVDGKPNLHLTLKPGSYAWPESIWKYWD